MSAKWSPAPRITQKSIEKKRKENEDVTAIATPSLPSAVLHLSLLHWPSVFLFLFFFLFLFLTVKGIKEKKQQVALIST